MEEDYLVRNPRAWASLIDLYASYLRERAFEALSTTPLSTARATDTEHDERGRLAIHALCRTIEHSSRDSITIVHLQRRCGLLPYWEFRTLMRLKLYEDAIRAKARKKARRNSRKIPTPQDEPTDADAETETPGVNGGGDLTSLADARASKVPPIQEAVPVNMASLVKLA